MARLPFVDTHVHFHDMGHPTLRYDWIAPGTPIDPVVGEDGAMRSQRYWADDFIAETRFQNVAKVVHVQAAIGSPDPVDETRWLQEFADRLGTPHGIVAQVDLAAPDVADQLARHRAFANYRGVRDMRDDDYLTRDDWQRGYALLEGEVFCDDPIVEQMPDARALAERFPAVTYCVDHAAYPGYGGKQRLPELADFDAWRDGLRDLARAESTVIKISGLGMCDHRWTVDSIRPWVLTCIEAFGVQRSFFGTNWSVDRLYSSYGDVLDAYAQIISDFTEEEQIAMFSANAERIFKLGAPA